VRVRCMDEMMENDMCFLLCLIEGLPFDCCQTPGDDDLCGVVHSECGGVELEMEMEMEVGGFLLGVLFERSSMSTPTMYSTTVPTLIENLATRPRHHGLTCM